MNTDPDGIAATQAESTVHVEVEIEVEIDGADRRVFAADSVTTAHRPASVAYQLLAAPEHDATTWLNDPATRSTWTPSVQGLRRAVVRTTVRVGDDIYTNLVDTTTAGDLLAAAKGVLTGSIVDVRQQLHHAGRPGR